MVSGSGWFAHRNQFHISLKFINFITETSFFNSKPKWRFRPQMGLTHVTQKKFSTFFVFGFSPKNVELLGYPLKAPSSRTPGPRAPCSGCFGPSMAGPRGLRLVEVLRWKQFSHAVRVHGTVYGMVYGNQTISWEFSTIAKLELQENKIPWLSVQWQSCMVQKHPKAP